MGEGPPEHSGTSLGPSVGGACSLAGRAVLGPCWFLRWAAGVATLAWERLLAPESGSAVGSDRGLVQSVASIGAGARASLWCLLPPPLWLNRGLCGPVGSGGGALWVLCGP
ncbi:hypothetical protein NDU88_000892 [Pleurodeles waltl]|uniref:Uncharacterized protein n=1 Tax=Pleurodeles waltl TaxID=8319 RepID=A0AAV7NAW1_PLEWA|nr:hypothetical protein NDU88_000892 [Pleurodeles waltl]